MSKFQAIPFKPIPTKQLNSTSAGKETDTQKKISDGLTLASYAEKKVDSKSPTSIAEQRLSPTNTLLSRIYDQITSKTEDYSHLIEDIRKLEPHIKKDILKELKHQEKTDSINILEDILIGDLTGSHIITKEKITQAELRELLTEEEQAKYIRKEKQRFSKIPIDDKRLLVLTHGKNEGGFRGSFKVVKEALYINTEKRKVIPVMVQKLRYGNSTSENLFIAEEFRRTSFGELTYSFDFFNKDGEYLKESPTIVVLGAKKTMVRFQEKGIDLLEVKDSKRLNNKTKLHILASIIQDIKGLIEKRELIPPDLKLNNILFFEDIGEVKCIDLEEFQDKDIGGAYISPELVVKKREGIEITKNDLYKNLIHQLAITVFELFSENSFFELKYTEYENIDESLKHNGKFMPLKPYHINETFTDALKQKIIELLTNELEETKKENMPIAEQIEELNKRIQDTVIKHETALTHTLNQDTIDDLEQTYENELEQLFEEQDKLQICKDYKIEEINKQCTILEIALNLIQTSRKEITKDNILDILEFFKTKCVKAL